MKEWRKSRKLVEFIRVQMKKGIFKAVFLYNVDHSDHIKQISSVSKKVIDIDEYKNTSDAIHDIMESMLIPECLPLLVYCGNQYIHRHETVNILLNKMYSFNADNLSSTIRRCQKNFDKEEKEKEYYYLEC